MRPRLEIVRESEAPGLPVPEPADAPRVLEVAASKARAGKGGVLVTVLARHGSAPSTPGQKLYLSADGACVGTVGGGAIEREILGEIAELVRRPSGEIAHAIRELKLGMCCGGRAEVLIEPIEGLVPCLVVGGGHVATATAPLLARVGFAVTVCDAPHEPLAPRDRGRDDLAPVLESTS
jgi:xanthine dehydrogenase accessory factor